MTRYFLGMTPALAVALWAGLGEINRVAAQSAVESTADVSADAAADTAADASSSDATSSAEPAATSSTTADASAADTTEAASDAATAESSTNADVSADAATTDAAASTDVQTSTTEADVQSSTSAESDVQSSATPSIDPTNSDRPADPTATVDANTGADANAGAAIDVDATTQQPGVNVNGQAAVNAGARGAQQRVDLGLQFGRVTDRGLTVDTIDRQSYFYNGGVRRGDVIVSYNGRPIRTRDDWSRWVVYQPGQRVPVIVLRDGRRETIYVTYRVQQQPGVYVEQPETYPRSAAQAYLGIALEQGVRDAAVVRSVNPGSPAEQAGLQAGDIIVALNGRGVASWRDVPLIVSTMQAGDLLDITFTRRMENRAQATLGIRNVDAPVNVRTQPALSSDVQATYSEPSVPATVNRAYQAAPGVEVRGVPQRPRDFDADGRVLDRDRINDEPGLDRDRENDRPGLDRDGGLRRLD